MKKEKEVAEKNVCVFFMLKWKQRKKHTHKKKKNFERKFHSEICF